MRLHRWSTRRAALRALDSAAGSTKNPARRAVSKPSSARAVVPGCAGLSGHTVVERQVPDVPATRVVDAGIEQVLTIGGPAEGKLVQVLVGVDQLLRSGATDVLDIDVIAPCAVRTEHDLLAVGRPDGRHIVRGVERKAAAYLALEVDDP